MLSWIARVFCVFSWKKKIHTSLRLRKVFSVSIKASLETSRTPSDPAIDYLGDQVCIGHTNQPYPENTIIELPDQIISGIDSQWFFAHTAGSR
jgi:hypothetical protein